MDPNLFLLAALLAALHVSTASAQGSHNGGFLQLSDAINEANANARACNTSVIDPDPLCLGAPVTVTLRDDVYLPSPLPPLNYSAHLIVTRLCNSTVTGLGSRCIIDGQDQFQVFQSPDAGAPGPALLELKNLFFQRAMGGVLANTYAVVQGRNLVFQYNSNGVILGCGRTGLPTRTFEDCYFARNNGTVVLLGGGKYGLLYNGTGVIVRRSTFEDNVGGSTHSGYAFGAVVLSGAGFSLFEDVTFVNNTAAAGSLSGAVYASQTTVTFRRVNFTGNVVESQGDGSSSPPQLENGAGAVYGESSYYYGTRANFCSCSFQDNKNLANGTTDSLLFENNSPAEFSDNSMDVSLCDTEVPEGSVFSPPGRGNITTGTGGDCFSSVC